MKIFNFASLFLLIIPFCNAQSTIATASDPSLAYLFEKFDDGRVLMKSGAVEKALLNYNTSDQSIVFKQSDDKAMTLTGLEKVDTIYVHNKKFIPGPDNLIYEVILDKKSDVQLLITYTSKTKPLVADIEKTGSSRKEIGEVSNTMTDIYLLRPYQGMFAVEIRKNYWLVKSRQLYRADAIRQFNRVFPHHEEDIKSFVANNQIKFNVEPDLIKLTEYCNAKL